MYETRDGKFYQKSNKPFIIVILCIALAISIAFSVGSAIWTNSVRREVDVAREQLARETETNRQLRAELESSQSRLEQCHFILGELRETTDGDITTVRDCIEVLEKTRYAVGCLSYYIDGCSSDDIYSRIDNWLESEGVEFVK